jgi:hypothetical protein
VCTIVAGEIAYQQPQHEWLVRFCCCIAPGILPRAAPVI